jgi:hypothetical protein
MKGLFSNMKTSAMKKPAMGTEAVKTQLKLNRAKN